ncbi:DNA alkylation repair protein [Paenibacillus allorhizosphaerae]|uniref:DNA alkylation repair protein n=1 Tax=Paenibacillus allorhizosphaerae TaxID=2849866 RepID=A0ABM8VJ82_9BACL|nr:DNA alkylation repair protein [Paenibacillus allorhizosphaerae]CAG7645123.1 hypothetical protein PAECIP111802_03436 [Paenibacillus allorhizosphaerae]
MEARIYEPAAGLEALLRTHANPRQAGPMQAYMRDQFPFLGIKSPERVALEKQYWKERGLPAKDELEACVRGLWGLPEREFQYAAMGLLERQAKKADRAQIVLLEELVVTKSWWDTVDLIAARLVGLHLSRFPELIPERAERWIASDNIWLQRTAILFQLGYKTRTDKELLFALIRRRSESDEFFIRKAIGWALREYSKTDEEAVRRFVAETQLSPLSVREALKHADKKRT